MNKAILKNKKTTRYLQDQYDNLMSYMNTCDSDIAKFILEWQNVVSLLEARGVVLIDKFKILWGALTRYVLYWRSELTGRYKEFNLFREIIRLKNNGVFNLLTRGMCLRISIKSECCGRSTIYGYLGNLFILTAIVATSLSSWEEGMICIIFSIVVRLWCRDANCLWLPTGLELFHWSNALSQRTLTLRSYGTLTTLGHWVNLIIWRKLLNR